MTIIYGKKDLKREAEEKDIRHIVTSDFRHTHEPFNVADLVLYIEDNLVVVLKNRYGRKELEEELGKIGLKQVLIKK